MNTGNKRMPTPTTLGKRVQIDRRKKGLTQQELAERLDKMRVQSRFRALGVDLTDKGEAAIRTWLAKLESGDLKREIGEGSRRLLAEALKADDRAAYQSLPLRDLAYVHEPDRPAQFEFEELWVFTQEPLEVRKPGYSRAIIDRWTADDVDNPIVYFVPPGGVAEQLVASLRTAARTSDRGQAAMDKNLHIEEVTASALALVPHFILRFRSRRGETPKYDGMVECAAAPEQERVWSPLREAHLDRTIGLLERADLLSPDLRYRPAAPGTKRKTADIEFTTYA